MRLKRLALLGLLLAAGSALVTFAASDHDLEQCGQQGQSRMRDSCDWPACTDDDTCQTSEASAGRTDAVRRPTIRSGPYQVYWGDLHGHTAHSDGKGTLDHYFSFARDTARLDFVVVTDHDYGNAPPWRMPRETWALTNEKADQYTVDGRFIGIAGYEWTSQPKYWAPAESLFTGPARSYNHKNVYFPKRVDYLFSSREPSYNSPDRLAGAVRQVGGLIHNDHLDSTTRSDQFDYHPANAEVIVNSEMWADTMRYDGHTYMAFGERTLQRFLGRGGKTGFVGVTDTHDGQPATRTAVLARGLSRTAIFEALRHRRNYAVSHAPIGLDVRINGHFMGEAIEIEGAPRIAVDIQGTDRIDEVVIIRDGAMLHAIHPGTRQVKFEYVDRGLGEKSYYYVRVIQADLDKHGNRSRAWSSPIWVTKKK